MYGNPGMDVLCPISQVRPTTTSTWRSHLTLTLSAPATQMRMHQQSQCVTSLQGNAAIHRQGHARVSSGRLSERVITASMVEGNAAHLCCDISVFLAGAVFNFCVPWWSNLAGGLPGVLLCQLSRH